MVSITKDEVGGGAYLQGDGVGGGVWKRVSGKNTGTQHRVWQHADIKWGRLPARGRRQVWGVEVHGWEGHGDTGTQQRGAYLQGNGVGGGVWKRASGKDTGTWQRGYLQGAISRCGGARILSGGAYLQGDGVRGWGVEAREWEGHRDTAKVSKKNVKWGVAYLQGNAVGGWGVEAHRWEGHRDRAKVGGGYLQRDHVKGGVWTRVGVRDMAKDEYKHKKEVR
ncbi:hypothetical protein EDC04DRAFT_2614253 [Pisolithus marmoratus]|nr:hypothetical protein EDC04DRAFT_2614253 [Pisolithus marmoratus]